MRWAVGVGALGLLLLPAPGLASEAPTSPQGEVEAQAELHLAQVLDSVERHHPLVRAELEEVRASRAGMMEARGAYDPLLQMGAEAAPVGYYDYSAVDASVSQLTPAWGSELYAGYRWQRGQLPQYMGELETLDRGEVRAGVRIPLWRDRAIDAARAQRSKSAATLAGAEADLEGIQLELWLQASAAYYAWVAAHEGRRVHQDLLSLAQRRAKQIAGKVRSGALAPFAELDNQRALLSRQAKLVVAVRKLEQARLKLSLFWRDESGRPLFAVGHKPPSLLRPSLPRSPGSSEAQARALQRHPLARRYLALQKEASIDLKLAANGVAPQVDLKGEVSRNFGSGSDEARTVLGPVAVKGALNLKLPLALRKARGKRERARAKLAAIEARFALVQDKIRLRVMDTASALRRSLERTEQERQAAEVAAQLADGERRRFDMGATTLIWVTIREKTAADARLDSIQALADARLAWASYQVALVERPGTLDSRAQSAH